MPGKRQSRILIAEDNELNQRVVYEMLTHRGFSLALVDNGEDALRALEAEPFDLLILDCMMPGMDGFETTRKIRASDPETLNPDIPILAVTALASEGDRDRCLDAGMNSYVSKPFRAETLFSHVDDLLSGHAVASNECASGWRREPDPVREISDLKEILQSMSGMLARDCESWQAELNSALEAGDLERLGKLAHKIRGTADIFECARLSAAAEQLERSAAEGDVKGSRTNVPEVTEALRQLASEVGQDV